MSGLRCTSFHSVKGGVGKSTLSTLMAVWLARSRRDVPVYLVDMDLTGTSLGDALPIEPPRWEGVEAKGVLDLLAVPTGFHQRTTLPELIDAREERPDPTTVVGVPFLNDFLLFATPEWNEQRDVPLRSLSWRMVEGPENLHVLPSSALPRDLEQTLPVIYDEEHAAFLEARLEHLLDAIVTSDDEAMVVFDTPPTIPGLSRSVLSLGLRLGRKRKISLEDSEDGYIPARLRKVALTWRAFLVTTPDWQDLRAAERWLGMVREEEAEVIRPLLNRVPVGNPQQVAELIDLALEHAVNPSLKKALRVEEDPGLQLFREEKTPPVLEALMQRVLGEDP